MQFAIKVILSLCLISLILSSSKLKSSLKNNYNLMILGDQGQFEYFKSSYEAVKKLDISKQEKIDKIFENTTYSVEDGNCKIKVNDKEMDLTDLTNSESRKQGMKNFDDLISSPNFKKQLEKASGIVFLGDTVYSENKRLSVYDETQKKAILGSQDKWNQRLTCAWNIFMSQLKKINLVQQNLIDGRVDIITGNHSYDVSFNTEENILKRLKKQKENSSFFEWDESKKQAVKTSNPNPTSYSFIKKLTVSTNGGRTITFVDINTAPFVCLSIVKNEEEYNDPKKCFFDQYYMDRWSYAQTTKYYLTLYDVVKNLDTSHWNVLRGHHPPTNFEDGDALFYWDVSIDGKNYNLMEKFEERNVRLFLGSHIHGQAVMTVPFRKTEMRPRGDKISAENDGSFCNINNLNAKSEELMDVTVPCTQNKFKVNLDEQNLMMVFINGNSGRYFDPISNGLRSNRGNTVWAKKKSCYN